VTAAAQDYEINQEYVDAITQIRRQEQAQMREYMDHQGCLMEFLERALDDPNPHACGKCRNCHGAPLLNEHYDDLANRAALFLRRSYQPIDPRKQWPSGNPLAAYGFRGRISVDLQACEGRALSLWRDAGWGKMVADGKYKHGRFPVQLIEACIKMLAEWNPSPAPQWIACVPSDRHPELVPDFAQRLAKALDIPFSSCVKKVKQNQQQKFMENSFQQAKNLDGVFVIDVSELHREPCLLVDDMVDSRWTFTVIAALLRQAGCEAVHPLALALNSPRMD